MGYLIIAILVICFTDSIFAGSACGTCGTKSGVMCIDDKTFALCNPNKTTTEGRYKCPVGMKCVDTLEICAETAPAGVDVCEPTCGKCSMNKRFACISRNSFALCYGQGFPSGNIIKCPDNLLCSTTQAPASTQFCFNPISIRDEHLTCYGDTVANRLDTETLLTKL